MPPSISFFSGVVSGGSGTLAETLVEGNVTGGTDLQVTTGDLIQFGGDTATFPAMRYGGGNGVIVFESADGTALQQITLQGPPSATFKVEAPAGETLILRSGGGAGAIEMFTDGEFRFLVDGLGANFYALTITAAGLSTFARNVAIDQGYGLVGSAIDTTAGDAAEINRMAGRFRKDTSGATFTLTNSLITANSIVMLQIQTIDATATRATVVPGAGSAVITFDAAPTGNVDVNFWVVN